MPVEKFETSKKEIEKLKIKGYDLHKQMAGLIDAQKRLEQAFAQNEQEIQQLESKE